MSETLKSLALPFALGLACLAQPTASCAVEISTSYPPAGMEMVPYDLLLWATNGLPPYTWTCTDSDLPDGLDCSSDGVLSGTPILAGTSLVTFAVSDALGDSASNDVQMVIQPNPNTRPTIDSTTPSQGSISMNEGSSKSFSLLAGDAEGTDLTYRWTLNGNELLNNGNEYLFDTPWGSIGHHDLRCYVSDQLWTNFVYAAWDVEVQDVPLEITSDTLPAGIEMVPYYALLAATNGVPPHSWAASPQVVAWGYNASGQTDVPAGLSNVVAIAAGGERSLALCNDGTVTVWGDDLYGQTDIPSSLSNVVAIAAGRYHSLALCSDGTVTAWGSGGDGQEDVPTGLSDVVAIATGGAHSLALCSGGAVMAWGNDLYGQTDVPTGLSNVVAIAAGEYHSLALCSDGTVKAWGLNGDGQTDVPTGLGNVVAVDAGYLHSLALCRDGTVTAWGLNNYGQTAVPTGLSNVVAIAAGRYHSLALGRDGAVSVWGANWSSQADIPSGLGNVVAITAGDDHNLAIQSSDSALPPGINLSHDGILTGHPTHASTYTFKVFSFDSRGAETDKDLDLVVYANPNNRPVVDSASPSQGSISMNEGSSNSFSLVASDPEGAGLAYRWTLNGNEVGSNSNEYVFDAPWGSIGHHDMRCYVSDELWTNVVYAAWDVEVQDVPLEITSDTLPAGMEMVPYDALLAATNGVPPYTWSCTDPNLPSGLFFSSDGVVSGSPILSGTPLVTFVVEDALGYSASNDVQIVIQPNPNKRPVVDSSNPAMGSFTMNEGSGNTFSLAASDPEGTGLAYRWMLNGNEVGSNSNEYVFDAPWGMIGYHDLRCYVSDQLWTDVVYAAWDVEVQDVPLEITSDALPAGMEMVSYDALLAATNGVSPYRWAVSPQVTAWGYDWQIQTDMPTGLSNVVAIAMGGSHALALCSDGTVTAWGDNRAGQTDVPTGLSNVVVIAAGGYHSMALCGDGTVTAWGNNLAGKTNAPTGLSNVVAIATSGSDCMALCSDGTVTAWGHNTFGQTAVPTGLSNVVAIAAGGSHSMALRSDGTVAAWGWDFFGQTDVPTDLSNVVAIAAGSRHSMALCSDGTVSAWGDDSYVQSDVPTGLSNVVAIAAGGFLSMAIQSSDSALPPGINLSHDGRLSGYPTLASTYNFKVFSFDSRGAETHTDLDLLINANPNMRPVISSNMPPSRALSMGEATNKLFQIWASDPEGGGLTYIWSWDGVQVGSDSSAHTVTTDWGDAGQHTLRCYASDDLWDKIVYSEWTVTVLDDNDGDGMPNWQELDFGRDPNDAGDAGNPSTVAGTVRGGGVGLAGAYVELRSAGGTSCHRAQTDSRGNYAIYSVLPGKYYAKAGAQYFADEWYDNATHRTSAVPYEVSADSVIGGFDFGLAPGQNTAFVEVTSEPSGATVYLDCQATGDITPVILNVGEADSDYASAGSGMAEHKITVKMPGHPYPPPRPVPACEAETVEMHFDLTASEAGYISVSTTPEDAEVFIDRADVVAGVSPLIVGGFAPGAHMVLVRKPGYLRPRPVIVEVANTATNSIVLNLDADNSTNCLSTEVQSVPPGATVYVDYLPTTESTDVFIDCLDAASDKGTGWQSGSHTIMLRSPGFLPAAPRYISDETEAGHLTMINLIADVEAEIDIDNDGMADQWEDAYRLKEQYPVLHGADDDPDRDGATNDEERRAGTNPVDPNSVLSISNMQPQQPGQPFMIAFNSVPGKSYMVLCTDSLKTGWVHSSGVIVASGYHTIWTTTIPEGGECSFFQIVVLHK